MTTLVVKPIDLAAPGSYGERRRILRLYRRLRAAKQADTDTVLALMDEMDEALQPRLRTDDGTSVDDALARLSANQFDELFFSIAFEGGAVGEGSKGNSTAGPEGSPAVSTPIG